MYENSFGNKAILYRVASYCALASVLLILLGLTLFILFPMPAALSSLSERLNFIARHSLEWRLPFFNVLIFILVQLPIAVGLFFLTRDKNGHLPLFAAIFGLMAFYIALQSTFTLVSAVPQMAKIFASTGDELLKFAIIANFNNGGLIQLHSFSFSYLILSVTLFGVMGLLFGIGLFQSLKLSRVVGWLLFWAGIFSLVGLVGYLAERRIIQLGYLVQIFIYFSTLMIMFPMFQHEAQLNQVISKKN